MTQAVKRACDACHRRKVKCDGINPCRNCSSAQLSCTYNAIPQKKGPKGSRAKVISELRETQRQTSMSAKAQGRIHGVSPPGASGLSPMPGLLTPEMVKESVDFYFAHVYEKIPILDRRHVEQQMLYAEQNRDAYCLLTSLCGLILLQPGMSTPAVDPFQMDVMPATNIVTSTLLLEETVRVRKGYDYFENPTMSTLATSYFISAGYQSLESPDKAWFYLRDATTMMHMLGMNKEETYMQWEPVESTRRRRLYWLAFVAERAHALQRQRPLTLQATINPPTLGDDPSDQLAHQLNDFFLQVNLFRAFDDPTTASWNKTRGSLSDPLVSSLHKQLDELVHSYKCQDGQFADLRTNQQWLKHTIWQLSNAGLSTNGDDALNFQYPAELSRELHVTLASQFPGQGMELIGNGLIEKMLDVTYSLTDYLSLQPAPRDLYSAGPRDSLNQIMNIVGVLRHGDNRFLPLLLSKTHEVLPRLTRPMLQHAPEGCQMPNIDIFDGFGNAGMAQPSQMHMAMDADYDRKFSVAEYDKKFASVADMGGNMEHASSSSGQPAPSDMASPFVSSPAVMSPPMEYPTQHGMAEYNSMSDMVMSPIGPGPGINQLQMNPQHQHLQHQPHHILQSQASNPPPMSQHHTIQQHGLQSPNNPQGISPPPVPTSHPMGQATPSLMTPIPRQGPQRANSFAIAQQPQIRTVGDFHALQRANSDTLQTMGGMTPMASGELDFGAIH